MVSITVAALLREITAQLAQAGCDAPAFDARCLLEDIGGVGRGMVDARAAQPLPPDAVQLVALDDETDAGRIVRFVGQDQVAVLLQYLDRLESRRYEKAEPCGEVEHVERERSAPAVADSYA